MKEAKIFYKKNILTPTPTEEHPNPRKYWEDNKKLYDDLSNMSKDIGNDTQATIDRKWFDEEWANVAKEEVSSSRQKELGRLYSKYNDYLENPLSAENDGQYILKEKDVKHTSMSIGDVIKVEDRYYIVAEWGFLRLYFR